jgi:hypothetical protein
MLGNKRPVMEHGIPKEEKFKVQSLKSLKICTSFLTMGEQALILRIVLQAQGLLLT